MFTLRKLNVVKVVSTEQERDSLKARGFVVVEKQKEVESCENECLDENVPSEMEQKTVAELRELAKNAKVQGYASMKKEDLITALEV